VKNLVLGVLIGFELAGTVIMAEQASEQHRGMTRGMMQEPRSGEQSQDIMRVHAFCRGALLDKWRSNQKGV
jgi:hypothetical protein